MRQLHTAGVENQETVKELPDWLLHGLLLGILLSLELHLWLLGLAILETLLGIDWVDNSVDGGGLHGIWYLLIVLVLLLLDVGVYTEILRRS